jgi:hypothetical protein
MEKGSSGWRIVNEIVESWSTTHQGKTVVSFRTFISVLTKKITNLFWLRNAACSRRNLCYDTREGTHSCLGNASAWRKCIPNKMNWRVSCKKGLAPKNALRLYDFIDVVQLLWMQFCCFKANEPTFIILHFATKHVSSYFVNVQHIRFFLSDWNCRSWQFKAQW